MSIISDRMVCIKEFGDNNIEIYINKNMPNIVHIGHWKGTREEAICMISKEYSDRRYDMEKCIQKIEQCYKEVPFRWKYNFYKFKYSIEIDKKVFDEFRFIFLTIAFCMIISTLFAIVLPESPIDPFMIYNNFMETSKFSAYFYASIWAITILSLVYEILRIFKIKKR